MEENHRQLHTRLFAHAGKAAKTVLRAAIDAIYPPTCSGCAKQLAEPGALCGTCWNNVRFIEKPYCPVLGTPFSTDIGEGMLSARAISNPPAYSRARAAVAYHGLALRFVHGLKFQDRQDNATWMADWMARAAPDLIEDADVIVPIPLHWRRLVLRRFNQSALLAQNIANDGQKSFSPSALKRVKATVSQRGLMAKDRAANLKNSFTVPDDRVMAIHGRRVLLIDDVITTGSTIEEATKALLKAGAVNVDVLAFAMVLKQES